MQQRTQNGQAAPVAQLAPQRKKTISLIRSGVWVLYVPAALLTALIWLCMLNASQTAIQEAGVSAMACFAITLLYTLTRSVDAGLRYWEEN